MTRQLIFIFLLLQASISKADCNAGNISILSMSPAVIDFRSSNQVTTTIQIAHDPFSGTQSCFFLNDLDYGSAASFLNRKVTNISTGSSQVDFNSYSSLPVNNNSIVRLAEEATQNTHVIYQNSPFTPSSSTQIQSRNIISELGSIPANSPPGIYTESLVLKLRARLNSAPAGDYSSFPVVDTRAIQFIYEIPKTLDISIVNSGQNFDENSTAKLMSFNNLETGNSQSASIIIQTNVGYRLFLSSTNDGFLEHTSSPSKIPFTLNVDGSNLNLSGSSSVAVEASASSSTSPSTGFSIPLAVTIGAMTGNEIGGRYRDVISISIQAF